MSITSGGTLGSVQNKTSSATLNLPVTAAVPVGAVVVLFLAYDNLDASNGFSASCIITDAKGNEYFKLVEWTHGSGGVGNGATSVIAICNVRTALASGNNIIVTFRSAVAAKAASAWRFNVAAGNVCVGDMWAGYQGTSSSPSNGANGYGTREKVWLWNVAVEGAPTCTTPAGFTAATPQSTSGGQAATNMGVRPFFKIDSLDGASPSATLGASSDWATGFISLIEIADPLPRPKMDTFTDRFEGTLAQWPDNYGSPAPVIEAGRAKIACVSGWSELRSDRNYPSGGSQAWGYDLGNSYAHARVYPPAIGNGTREIYMQLTRDYNETDRFKMYVSGANLYTMVVRSMEEVPISNAPYNATNHAWWRIRESGGTIYFETSPNGIDWTQFGSTIPRPFPVSQMFVSFLCLYNGTETADFAYIDDFNYVPPVFPLDETLIDNFDRADARVDAGVGATIWKSAWYDGGVATDMRVISNQLGILANAYTPAYTLRSVQNSCDVVIDCVVPPGAPNNEFGLYFCMTDVPSAAYDGYAVFWASGTWILRRYLNGANVGNITTAAGTLVAGDSVWVSKVGSVIKLYKRPSGGNYGLVLQATDANHNLPGKIILELSDTAQRWENLRGGPFVPSSRSVLII